MPDPALSLDHLEPGREAQGFAATALYVDAEDRPRGARFVHTRTRFVFDYLRIESAPQSLVYVGTYPLSDSGEAHTQEHLLLGKGNAGRMLGNVEHVMLAQSNAFTAQDRTAYFFHTSAGVEAFWNVQRANLEALLRPDYSDEEIRREVRDFGVARAPDGTLSLDEKGTVYNEMVGSFAAPGSLPWFDLARLIYGPEHPYARAAGGRPEGIRTLTPADIRKFHAAHYQLGNMGMIGAFPSSVPLATVLAKVGETLESFATPGASSARFFTEADVPPAAGAPPGSLRVTEYPYATADHPGPMTFAWPATRHLDIADRLLLEALLGAVAGGDGSTLHKALVDRETRAVDVGATQVWTWVTPTPGQAVYVGLANVSSAHADEASLLAVRRVIMDALRAIAALPDGSKELAALGERVAARVVEAKRGLDKLLDTPPSFGARATDDTWILHLDDVVRGEGFRKSLTHQGPLARALALAHATENPWRDRLRAWGLLEEPYGVAARPSPALRARLDAEKEARLGAELARLRSLYGTSDTQATLGRREAEITRATEVIARAEASVPMPPFVSDPPMTDDDALAWHTDVVRGVPVVRSTFDTMKSATVGIALRLDALPDEALPLLSVLTTLLRDVGVVRDGVPVRYDEMRDRLRREVLGLDVYLDTSFAAGRAELVLEASGNDEGETRRALGWLRDVLTSPDWRAANLPRIRDAIAERAAQLHDVMTAPEERWVADSAEAYWRQDSRLLLHAGSFLTRAHDAHRVSWQVEEEDGKAFARFMEKLGSAFGVHGRARLARLTEILAADDWTKVDPSLGFSMTTLIESARELTPFSRAYVKKAARDLGQLLSDIPDDSLSTDWAALCSAIARDAARPAERTLEALRRALATLRHAPGARAWVVGSKRHQDAIAPDLEKLLGALDPAPAPRVEQGKHWRVIDRARMRDRSITSDAFVALVKPSASNAAIADSRPAASYDAPTDDALVDFLASNIFGGTGSHSFYKRIWGAGLAYSGYVTANPGRGRLLFYADRVADLPQLVRFAEGEVRHAVADPRYVDYALARGFGSRAGDTYESRARGIATDLAEGRTPERVRAFRTRLLALRGRAGLADAMHARLIPVLAPILPTLAPGSEAPAASADPPAARDLTVRFVVGPEVQIAAYERALRGARGEATRVVRLYPRDFWDE